MTDDRRMTTDRFFGGVDERLSNLHEMLVYVDENEPNEGGLRERLQESLGASSDSTIDSYLGFLRSIGLITRERGTYDLTPDGVTYLESQDQDVLFERLTANVKGFEEILVFLHDSPKTLPDITSSLQEVFPDYRLPEGVVQRHLEWLECIDYVERIGGAYHITERGTTTMDDFEDQYGTLEEIRPSNSEESPDSVEKDLTALRRKAVDSGSDEAENRSGTTRTVTEYSRSPEVRRYVKERADGVCEGCEEPAPFQSKTGKPYLQAHHIYELSEGGPDTPSTVVALCPNCHYRIHHGVDGAEYNRELEERVAEFEDHRNE